MSIRILILEDELEMRALLQRYLQSQGFSVHIAANARQLDTLLERQGFDALLLDLMMPDEDGLSICRRLRAGGETIPILMLTARGDPIDRIIGIEMGADDYLPKPFEPRELAARLQALVRRQTLYAQGTTKPAQNALQFGAFTLDFKSRRLLRGDEKITLTGGEYALLHSLAANPNRALGRDRLLDLLQKLGQSGNRAEPVTERSIDVQILRLRRLIEADPAHPRFIQTVWGKGYMFVPNAASGASGANGANGENGAKSAKGANGEENRA